MHLHTNVMERACLVKRLLGAATVPFFAAVHMKDVHPSSAFIMVAGESESGLASIVDERVQPQIRELWGKE